MSRWTRLFKISGGHKYFSDAENPGHVAIADDSGATPDETDDGVLYIAKALDVTVDRQDHWSIPLVYPTGRPTTHTSVSADEAIFVASLYGMTIRVESKNRMISEYTVTRNGGD